MANRKQVIQFEARYTHDLEDTQVLANTMLDLTRKYLVSLENKEPHHMQVLVPSTPIATMDGNGRNMILLGMNSSESSQFRVISSKIMSLVFKKNRCMKQYLCHL